MEWCSANLNLNNEKKLFDLEINKIKDLNIWSLYLKEPFISHSTGPWFNTKN